MLRAIGAAFPGNNAVSDIILLCCADIRKKIESGEWKSRSDETVQVEQMEFERLLQDVKEKYGTGFTKSFREMPTGEFFAVIMEELEQWTFIRRVPGEHRVVIYPAAGKMTGRYPDDYIPVKE